MKTRLLGLLLAVVAVATAGCYSTVDQGCYGRVKTASGWEDKVYPPGTVTCFGRDTLYQADATEDTEEGKIEILVGGKVNLKITTMTRYGLSKEPSKTKKIFEDVKAGDKNTITRQDLYKRYVKMIVQARPQEIIGAKPDVLTVVTNLQEVVQTVRKAVIDESQKTPVEVYSFEITNYDWPDSITTAQEELAGIELSEKKESARVAADLKKAEGRVAVEEANVLVETKKAEGIAAGIKIVRDVLKDCPEYLQWHTVRVMSEAATGPNNSFILFPYNMPGIQTGPMVQTALFDQIRKSDASTGSTPQKSPAVSTVGTSVEKQ